MSDILREWLIHQLGVELHSLHPNYLCSKFQNGVFIGKLLQNYNIVSSNDFSLLVNEEDEAIKISNFRYLKTWLNMINILLDDDTVNGIISGQRPVVLGFLYKLCFILEDPNNLNLNGHAKKIYKSFGNVDILDNSNVSIEAFINLPHEKHYSHVDDSFVLPKKSIGNLKSLYDEINEFEDSLPMKRDCWNARGDQSCARYLSDLKGRKQQSKMYDSWRKEMINNYLQDSFDENMSHNQYVLRNKSMPDKLYRMSDCERKMLEKVNNARFVTKKNNTTVVKNKVEFIKDSVGDERPRPKITEEVKPNMKEELIKRNNDLSVIELKNTVKSTVFELIDISVRRGAYKKKTGRNIPKCLWDDWMEMFVEGRPLYNLPVGSRLGRLILDPQRVSDDKLNTDEELRSQTILNQRDILKYLKVAQQELHVKPNEPPVVSRVLGFIVHDVFTSIYKLPAPLVAIDSGIFRPVMSVFNCEIEDALKQEICAALTKRDILPVLPEIALQYCLCGYYQETDNDELVQILENSENSDTKTAGENVSTLIGPVQSKQTQTPQNIITNYESERISCGKNAFIKIYEGKPLPKYSLIDCVLCFIKEKNMQGGWVIFGLQREEIMILEERLARQKQPFPPFGVYSHMKNINPTILVPFKGPNYGDNGKYLSSLTSYLKVESCENIILDDEWDDVYKYYGSQHLLTLLKYTDVNIFLNNHIIELFCDVLTGQVVDWSEVTNWIDCTYDAHQNNLSIISDSYKSKTTEIIFEKEKLFFKTEFDYIDYLSSMFPFAFYNLSQKAQTVIVEMTSKLFNVQLNGNDGAILATFWKSLENEFVKNMERCFFYRRILMYEREPFLVAVDNYLNEILYKPNSKKIDLVRRLQYDLINIPNDTLTIADATRQLLSAVLDAKKILTQMINRKINTCVDFIDNNIITNWLDKQSDSIFKTYTCMLQVEVDRFMNTILFINSYMSKLHNQIVSVSLIPRPIDVSLLKKIAEKDQMLKVNVAQNMKSVDDYYKIFNATVNAVSVKIQIISSKILEWLEEIENSRSSKSIKKDNMHLKVWGFLVKSEDLRSANQFQIILDQFTTDIKEANNCLIQFRTDAIHRINGRLQHELAGVERICNLFEIALKEKCYVRHEILFVDDNFYLNPENVVYPNIPPPRPFPLLEEEYPGVLTINNLEIITRQLALICPNRRISIVALSNWLTNFPKHDPPIIAWHDTTYVVLRTIFGCSVHYIDWSDFVIHCLELSYPSADDLLDLKNQYANVEKNNKNYLHSNHTEGTIDKDEYDSVLLWYQKTLPSNPSVCLRYMKIKDLLFEMFSIGGKLDYVIMLLALCKDCSSVMGLLKAISLVLDQNIMVDIDLKDDVSHGNEKHDIELLIETIYKAALICLKNYLAPDKRDIDDLMSSILNMRSTMCKSYGDTCSVMELIKNEEFKTLSEVGFRFNSRSLFDIVNNLK